MYKIIAALGGLAATTWLAGSVYAQSALVSKSGLEEYTISGDSLQIENLSIEEDYQEFFKPAQNQEDISANVANSYIYGDGDDGVWQISDRVQLQVNEPLTTPIFPVPFQPEGASLFDDIDRVGVQYQLSQ